MFRDRCCDPTERYTCPHCVQDQESTAEGAGHCENAACGKPIRRYVELEPKYCCEALTEEELRDYVLING